MKLIDADALMEVYAPYEFMADMGDAMEILANFPTVDAVPVIRCKDCKHRPIVIDSEGNGFDYDFPDERCPCQCEDGWYNWMPRDEWYCANGERKE